MLAPDGSGAGGASGCGRGADVNDQLALDLMPNTSLNRSVMLAGQQPSYLDHSQAAESEYLDQLAFDGLLASDEDGFDLFGSPIPSGSAGLAPFDVTDPPVETYQRNGPSSPVRYDAQGPPSSSRSVRRASSGSGVSSTDGHGQRSSLLPPTDAFTIDPSALSMNPSAMHLPTQAPSPHHLLASPGLSSSDHNLSPVRRCASVSPRQHVNAVAGPGPASAAARRAPVGVVDLSTPSSFEQPKRGRSTRRESRCQGNSPSPVWLPSPPVKRKKMPPPAQPPPPARVSSGGGSKRTRSTSLGSSGGPSQKKSKGETAPALSLDERIAKAYRLNAIKAKLRTIAMLYDDDARTLLSFTLSNPAANSAEIFPA